MVSTVRLISNFEILYSTNHAEKLLGSKTPSEGVLLLKFQERESFWVFDSDAPGAIECGHEDKCNDRKDGLGDYMEARRSTTLVRIAQGSLAARGAGIEFGAFADHNAAPFAITGALSLQ